MRYITVNLPGKVKDCNKLVPQHISMFEAFWVEDDLSNELIVWPAHGHRSEKLLEVVRELLPASIPFTCRVQCDEHPRIKVQFNLEDKEGENIMIAMWLDRKLEALRKNRQFWDKVEPFIFSNGTMKHLFLHHFFFLIRPPFPANHKSFCDV